MCHVFRYDYNGPVCSRSDHNTSLYRFGSGNMTNSYLLNILVIFVFSCQVQADNCRNCFHRCIEGECDAFGCKVGYHGVACTSKCPSNCFKKETEKPVCDRRTGTCVIGCVYGRYGKHCNKSCSENCLDSLCTQEDGTCVHGCREGWHGLNCSRPCSQKCRDEHCDRNGLCLSCEKGSWGVFCENNCTGKCRDGLCRGSLDGREECEHGCESGWSGENCVIPSGVSECNACSGGRQDHRRIRRDETGINNKNCTSDEICQICPSGFYGEDCDKNCSRGCALQNNETWCSKTGICNGCLEGHFGNTCGNKCITNCKDNICEQITGFCVQCPETKHGNYCEKSCSKNCTSSLCHRHNSSCVAGCVPGLHGTYCNETCSSNCKQSVCSLTRNNTLECSYGCKDGYWGSYCEKQCNVSCNICERLFGSCIDCNSKTHTSNPAAVVQQRGGTVAISAVTPILGIIIIALVAYIIYLKRRYRSRPHTSNHPDDQENAAGTLMGSRDQAEK